MKIINVLGSELKIRLSPTFIEKASCPQYLKFHYVDKIGEKYVRVAGIRGSAVHAAIADLTEVCQNNEIQPEVLDDTDLKDALQKNTPPVIMSEVGLMLEWMRKWKERYKFSKHLYGWEERVPLDTAFDECAWDVAMYRGILDVIDINGDHCTVTDYKSQPHILSQTDLDAHEQLTFYCWLAWKMYPHLRKFTARIWYLRYGFYDSTTRTEADLELFEHALMVRERKIEEIDNWDPVPGKHCQYCDYIHLCPLANDLTIENSQIISQEQAVQAAQRITVMEALVKELKIRLKEYVNANDNVRVGDRWEYGFHHSSSDYWKLDELVEVLGEHEILELSEYDEDIKLDGLANPDVKKIKKLIKKASKENEALAEALADIKHTRHQTRFLGAQPETSK